MRPRVGNPGMVVDEMRILLDVDGVCADFAVAWLHQLYLNRGRKHQLADITEFDFSSVANHYERSKVWAGIDNEEEFCLSLKPYPNLDEHLAALRAQHEVIAVTSPRWHSRYWMPERFQWLTQHGFDEGTVVFTDRKELVRGDILVDDKRENVQSWMAQNPQGIGVIFDQPWNQKPVAGALRVRDLGDVRAIVVGLTSELEKGTVNP